jgi:AcrR family transcriptional regulator
VRDEDVDWLLAPLPSGRHNLSREQVIRSQRTRLLRAAIAVAGENGYAAMTVSTVIAQANVSRKTFYELFVDREDCFLAAYESVLERALSGLQLAFAIEAPWPTRLRAALAWALDALAAHPHETRVAFVEALAAGPRVLERRDRALHELTPLLAPGFAAASLEASVPASMPTAIVGAFGELIGAHVRRGAITDLPQLLPDLLYCALAPFLGPGAAAEAAADAGQPVGAASGGIRV